MISKYKNNDFSNVRKFLLLSFFFELSQKPKVTIRFIASFWSVFLFIVSRRTLPQSHAKLLQFALHFHAPSKNKLMLSHQNT